MKCIMPGFPVHHQLPEFTQIYVHWVDDAIQPSHSLLSASPPTFNLSQHQGLFQWVSSSHQVAKVLEFSFSISPSNEHSGLISFRMDWLDLLAVQGTLRSGGQVCAKEEGEAEVRGEGPSHRQRTMGYIFYVSLWMSSPVIRCAALTSYPFLYLKVPWLPQSTPTSMMSLGFFIARLR